MLTKEAIEQLQNTAGEPEIIEVDDFKYLITPGHMKINKVMPATPEVLEISSLQGVVEFLLHSEQRDDCIVHISDYRCVEIVSILHPLHMTRRYYLSAKAYTNMFTYGYFLPTQFSESEYNP